MFGVILTFLDLFYTWIWLVEKLLLKCRWLFFFVVASRLFCKTMCTVTAKQYNCRFWSLQGLSKTWQQALHFLQTYKLVVFWLKGKHFSLLHVGQYTSPIVLILSTHNSFFLYLVDWNGALINKGLLGTKFILFSKEKACFVCFCRLYVLLQHKRNFVNKQPGSTFLHNRE